MVFKPPRDSPAAIPRCRSDLQVEQAEVSALDAPVDVSGLVNFDEEDAVPVAPRAAPAWHEAIGRVWRYTTDMFNARR